jgi:hypothetical protein
MGYPDEMNIWPLEQSLGDCTQVSKSENHEEVLLEVKIVDPQIDPPRRHRPPK